MSDLRRQKMNHGYKITWKDFAGNWYVVHATGFATPEEAYKNALLHAKTMGWTPRKWWMFWRWFEKYGPIEPMIQKLEINNARNNTEDAS